MCMCIDAWSNTQQDPGSLLCSPHYAYQALQFAPIVQHNASYSKTQRQAQLLLRFVIAVEGNVLHGEVDPLRHQQFTSRYYIESYPLLTHQPRYQRREVGFRRVKNTHCRSVVVRLECLFVTGTGVYDCSAVKNIERGAIYTRQVRYGMAGYTKYAFG